MDKMSSVGGRTVKLVS